MARPHCHFYFPFFSRSLSLTLSSSLLSWAIPALLCPGANPRALLNVNSKGGFFLSSSTAARAAFLESDAAVDHRNKQLTMSLTHTHSWTRPPLRGSFFGLILVGVSQSVYLHLLLSCPQPILVSLNIIGRCNIDFTFWGFLAKEYEIPSLNIKVKWIVNYTRETFFSKRILCKWIIYASDHIYSFRKDKTSIILWSV